MVAQEIAPGNSQVRGGKGAALAQRAERGRCFSRKQTALCALVRLLE